MSAVMQWVPDPGKPMREGQACRCHINWYFWRFMGHHLRAPW